MIPTAAVTELQQLMARYATLIDDRAYDQLGEVFCDDAVFAIESVTDETLDGLGAIIDHMRSVRHPVTHLIGNVLVAESPGDGSGERFVVESSLVAVRRDGTVGTGRYRDVVVRTDSGWRIETRRFRLVSSPHL
jgi:3-phenylpropionate/cinnamic acid dioxygenase small subunit